MEGLYSQRLIEHAKNPNRFYILPNYHVKSRSQNPLCGDEITIYLKRVDEKHVECSFMGQGCSVCLSSASILMELTSEKTVFEIKRLMEQVLGLKQDSAIKIDSTKWRSLWHAIEKFPTRYKCAALAFKALEGAFSELEGRG